MVAVVLVLPPRVRIADCGARVAPPQRECDDAAMRVFIRRISLPFFTLDDFTLRIWRMCEREQKINKDEGGTPPFLHKTSTKKGRAFLKILEDKNKKKAPLLLVLLLSIDISSSTYYIVYSTKNGTGMVQVF